MASFIESSAQEKARKEWQDPEAILNDIGLRSGDTFIDIGCGNGFFTVPAAKIVGDTGKVYGLDVSPTVIEALKERAKQAGLVNIETTVGWAEETPLCSECADFVFFGIVMHDFEDRQKVVRNARQMLKNSGKIVDLDFRKIIMPFGPPLHIKLAEDDARHLVESEGFRVRSVKQIPPYSYLLTAEKTG